MGRRVHTADDVLRHALTGATELVVAPGDRLTPLARDVASQRGVTVVERTGAGPSPTPRLHHVAGVHVMPLQPFPVELHRPEMDVRLRDVLGSDQGLPMAAGVLSLREGSFPWTLDYDEVEYVIEGELHVTTADQQVIGRPGDVIAVPKGASITFGTPSWARFLYVTYP
ncbi:MAG TPA: cupin domain-containing protein, partial [Propionicimonas sp.]|nr:cupin domain-containing protein [Propionicimonas sp.]